MVEVAGSVGVRASSEIEVRLFRLILFLPFAIEPGDPEKLWTGAELVEAAARQLDRSASWQTREPLDHLDGRRPPGRPVGVKAYEEFVYFQPSVQRFLYGPPTGEPDGSGSTPPISLFARTDIEALDVEVWNGLRNRVTRLRLAVDRLNLYLFDTGNALLTVELFFDPKRTPELAGRDGFADYTLEPRLDDVLAVAHHLRRVFPPFFQSNRERNAFTNPAMPQQLVWLKDWLAKASPEGSAAVDATPFLLTVGAARCSPLHDAWQKVVEPLRLEGYGRRRDVQLSLCGDDRAPLMLLLGVDDPDAISRSDWVRIAMADRPGPPGQYPEVETTLDGFEAAHCFDRYWQRGNPWTQTRQLNSGFCHAMVGRCHPIEGSKEHDPAKHWRNDFADLLQHHFRRQYFQLGLISHFHKVALGTLSERLAREVDRQDARHNGRFQKAVAALQREALRFTHRYWFVEVSPQPQATQLFELWRRHLGTERLYDQLTRELEASNAFLDREEQRRLATSAERLTKVGLPGIGLAVLTGFFGMNFFEPDDLAPWRIFVVLLALGSGGLILALLYAALIRDRRDR